MGDVAVAVDNKDVVVGSILYTYPSEARGMSPTPPSNVSAMLRLDVGTIIDAYHVGDGH